MNKYITFVFVCLVSFLVYLGTATNWHFRPFWSLEYINVMATSLRQGRLDIPNPGVTYDLAHYNGRWFMTWGPLAALVHIPLQRIAGGRFVPTIYTSALFGALTVGVVWIILRRIAGEWFPSAPAWHALFFLSLYAFGTMQFYLSTIGSVWQVNQVVSTFFGVLGVAVIFKKNRSTRDYVISSTLCSITFWGRPVVGLLLVIPIFLLIYDIRKNQKPRPVLRTLLLATFLPVAVSLLVLLFYNTARFGSPMETGHRFLEEAPDLAAKRQQYGMLSFVYVPVNVWHMVLAPPQFSWKSGPRLDIDLNGNSIFFLSPLLLFAFPTIGWVGFKSLKNIFIGSLWIGIIATALPSLFYYNTGWIQLGYRYALDFSFILVVLAYFWFKGRIHWWMILLLMYTVWINYSGIRLLQ